MFSFIVFSLLSYEGWTAKTRAGRRGWEMKVGEKIDIDIIWWEMGDSTPLSTPSAIAFGG